MRISDGPGSGERRGDAAASDLRGGARQRASGRCTRNTIRNAPASGERRGQHGPAEPLERQPPLDPRARQHTQYSSSLDAKAHPERRDPVALVRDPSVGRRGCGGSRAITSCTQRAIRRRRGQLLVGLGRVAPGYLRAPRDRSSSSRRGPGRAETSAARVRLTTLTICCATWRAPRLALVGAEDLEAGGDRGENSAAISRTCARAASGARAARRGWPERGRSGDDASSSRSGLGAVRHEDVAEAPHRLDVARAWRDRARPACAAATPARRSRGRTRRDSRPRASSISLSRDERLRADAATSTLSSANSPVVSGIVSPFCVSVRAARSSVNGAERAPTRRPRTARPGGERAPCAGAAPRGCARPARAD